MSEFHKDRELEHMFELQGNNRSGCPDHTADIWDKRMKNWKQNFWTANLKDNGSGKSMARVRETAPYLKQAGVLGPDTDVIDIGCGPGRFVSEFARTARMVVGVDISPRAIEYARLFTKESGQMNTGFLVSDFLSLDLKSAGLKSIYDLAFCSLSPAVSGREGLSRFMGLTRSWCCMNSIVSGRHELHQRIAREVFHKETLESWNGQHFYTTFNILLLSGYQPMTSYYRQAKENERPASREFAEISASIILPEKERTSRNIHKIFQWMEMHADTEGNFQERSLFTYGRLLWNIHQTY